MVYPHKWSPVSCRSSAGQGKLAGQRPTFYRCATQATRTTQTSGVVTPLSTTNPPQTKPPDHNPPSLLPYVGRLGSGGPASWVMSDTVRSSLRVSAIFQKKKSPPAAKMWEVTTHMGLSGRTGFWPPSVPTAMAFLHSVRDRQWLAALLWDLNLRGPNTEPPI